MKSILTFFITFLATLQLAVAQLAQDQPVPKPEDMTSVQSDGMSQIWWAVGAVVLVVLALVFILRSRAKKFSTKEK